MLVYICFPVFSPFSAHFYPPLHHNGKGSTNQEPSSPFFPSAPSFSSSSPPSLRTAAPGASCHTSVCAVAFCSPPAPSGASPAPSCRSGTVGGREGRREGGRGGGREGRREGGRGGGRKGGKEGGRVSYCTRLRTYSVLPQPSTIATTATSLVIKHNTTYMQPRFYSVANSLQHILSRSADLSPWLQSEIRARKAWVRGY